jgi:hypothetical protein
MDLRTSFEILGLDLQADQDQAKRAYKAQVRRWHPDQFPEGSTTKAGAEEQLKQINIAYARVKAHLALHRPEPVKAAAAASPRPSKEAPRRHETSKPKPRKRSWVDHLFDTLNGYTSNGAEQRQQPSSGRPRAKRRKSFEQVLGEMTGEKMSRPSGRKPAHEASPLHNGAAGYRRHRRQGGSIGAVGGTESTGPVKPVSRVRGIGKSR